ncbi:MAG: hypothetical protein MJK14_27345, partial [Rivularia sp. ALOHA_DT_140]|nr:hypothetical protein [Rivularia sp. ALOHA_DT_140]
MQPIQLAVIANVRSVVVQDYKTALKSFNYVSNLLVGYKLLPLKGQLSSLNFYPFNMIAQINF